MSKHTPGPWHIVEDRVPASLEVFAGKTAIAECWRRADVPTEKANARLISAAPDLLEALKKMVECSHTGNVYLCADASQKAYAAIAKATGGTNE